MIKDWTIDEQGRAIVHRSAQYWRRSENKHVTCNLCYRNCELTPGQVGPCKVRENRAGKLILNSHGVLSCMILQRRGFQVDPFMTFKPGALSLFIGGVGCNSGCVFCMSKEITWNPTKIQWGYGERHQAKGLFFTNKAMVHPKGVIWAAQYFGCTQIEFGINEPLMTFEYTLDTARLAKEAGLDVVIETNGFSNPKAIREMAPYVDAVDLGIKGSGDPEFYSRWMRSTGAVDAVKKSAMEWRQAGVHLIIGDVIAPGQLQSDSAFDQSIDAFYGWIRDNLGEKTEILITSMLIPGPESNKPTGGNGGLFLPGNSTILDKVEYASRMEKARSCARGIGFHYAHFKTVSDPIRCHACGNELLVFSPPKVYCVPCLMPFQFCDKWDVESHVTNGHCDSCGTQVPVITLTPKEQDSARNRVLTFPESEKYKGQVNYRPAD